MTNSDILSGLNRKVLISGFDVETSNFSMLTPKIELIGHYIGNSGVSIFFDTSKDYFDFLFPIAKEQTFYINVAHNLKFDLNLLFSETKNKLPNGWVFDKIHINGEFPRFVVCKQKIVEYYYINEKKSGKKRRKKRQYTSYMYFIDLMNFVKFSLADLMKTFTPHLLDAKQTGRYDFERNVSDITATCEIYMNHFFRVGENQKRLFPKLSISSIAQHDLLTESGYEWEYEKDGKKERHHSRPKWLVDIEKLSYRGGIVWFNKELKNEIIDNVTYFDINSMYPFIMKELKVPYALNEVFNIRLDTPVENIDFIQNFTNEETFNLYFISFETNIPLLPIKKDGKLDMIPNELFSGWYCENELLPTFLRFENPYIFFKVLKCVSYKAEKGKFASFVDKWYNVKVNAEILNDEINRTTAKLMMNSAYGKFGQTKIESYILSHDLPNYETLKSQKIGEYVNEKGQLFRLRHEFNEIYVDEKIKDLESKNSVTIVASAITSGARGYIMSFFDPRTAVYMDTDSQVLKSGALPLSNELGGWKAEKSGSIQVFGKKWYKFNNTLKCKGVPKKAIEINNNIYEFYRLINPRESIRRGLPLFSAIRVIKDLNEFKQKKLLKKPVKYLTDDQLNEIFFR